MCKMLKVSRSGYYAWKKRGKSKLIQKDKELLRNIEHAYTQSRRAYGSPRIYEQLKQEGIKCGRHRIARIMRENAIVAQRQRQYKRATETRHGRNISENILNQNFHVEQPNKVWASDMSVFWTGSGWIYLAIVMDLYSRRIVGWAMKNRMTEELTINALNMAINRRIISNGMIHHSDQGSQYASNRYRDVIKKYGFVSSISRKGNCYDNAVVESFFKTIKAELAREHRFKTREEARTAIFEYIEAFYNRKRLHSGLRYLSPVDYERLNGVSTF